MVLALAEEDVSAGGEGVRIQFAGEVVGPGIGVNTHVTEVVSQ